MMHVLVRNIIIMKVLESTLRLTGMNCIMAAVSPFPP